MYNFKALFHIFAATLFIALVINPKVSRAQAQAFGIQQVAAGAYHTCAITEVGGVKCWGDNALGQLGNGTTISSNSPVDVVSLQSNVVSVAAGQYYTCALTVGGAVECWGANFVGELGHGSTSFNVSRVPTDVVGLASGVTAISAGDAHVCAIIGGAGASGGVKCWGNNYSGQLGNGSDVVSAVPVDVVGLTAGVVAIANGGGHTCAVTVGGATKCWGSNGFGQLGNGSLAPRTTAVDVGGLTSGVVSIAAGVSHTCAITVSGGASCWGKNSNGQLGNGNTSDSSTPVGVVSLSRGAISITGGFSHSCALMNDGGVKCWGDNSYGQLGDATAVKRTTAFYVSGLSSGVASISGGYTHTCAITTGGSLKCWGANASGQLGIGTNSNNNVPLNVFVFTTGSQLTSSINPAMVNQSVTFAARISGSAPTGTITFNANGLPISGCSAVVVVGSGASCSTSFVVVGVSNITATYTGDANNNRSVAVLVGQQVVLPAMKANQAPLTLIASATVLRVGGVATLTTTGGSGAGEVTFYSDNPAGCAVAGFTLSVIGEGGCTITASKASDNNYNLATSNTSVSTNAVPFASKVTVLASSNPTTVDAGTILTATVQAGAALSSAQFAIGFPISAGETRYIRFDLIDGTFGASLTPTSITELTTPLNIQYSVFVQGGAVGDNFAVYQVTAGAAGIPQTDQIRLDIAALTASTPGAAVKIKYSLHSFSGSAANSPPANTGLIAAAGPISLLPGSTLAAGGVASFAVGSIPVAGCGAIAVSLNTANCTTSFTSVGNRSVSVIYSGDTNYLPSSGSFGISVGAGAQTIAVNAPASVTSIAPPFVIDAIGGGSGNPVTFTSLTSSICAVSGANGSTINLSGALGTCTIRASQPGNANYDAAAIVDRSIAVVPAAPSNLVCSSGANGSLSCSSSAATAPTGVMILGYQFVCTDSRGVSVIQSSVAPSVQFTGLPTGHTYSCQVRTSLNTGVSGFSESSAKLATHKTVISRKQMIDVDGSGNASLFLAYAPSTTIPSNAAPQLGRWNGTAFTFSPIADIGSSWNILGLGDFTGGGKTGIVSRNANEQVRVDMCIPTATPTTCTSTIVRNSKNDWVVDSVGDLDGDGKSDIIWRYIKQPATNDTGVVFAWYMDGNANAVNVNEVKRRGGAPLSWNLVGVTDINGDGMDDLIWLSPTNEIRSLTSQIGRTWVNERIGNVPVGYVPIKLGDVNGDGKGDVLFRDAQGRVKVWLMNGAVVTSEIDLPSTPADWKFFASGDFNGDETMDIVWQKPDGTLVVWLMNAAAPETPTIVNNAGTVPANFVNVEP